MHVDQLFNALAVTRNVEIVEAALPDVLGLLGKQFLLSGDSTLAYRLQHPPRETLFERLHHPRRVPLFAFADQQMNVGRPHLYKKRKGGEQFGDRRS
jgi:hypothetical protein